MNPQVAIACSGLGRIRRGNETWAHGVAEALHAVGEPVTLFGGSPDLATGCPYVPVRNWPRHHPLTRRWLSWHHRYLLEQVTFAFNLRPHLRRGGFDIVHTGDPNLAQQIQRQARSLAVGVVYKDGLLLGPAWSRKFDYVHVLAPYYLECARAAVGDIRNWFMIPHLVDVRRFAAAADQRAVRGRWLGQAEAQNPFVVLAVGDYLPESRKRLDWVVQEFSRLPASAPACLVLAGQATRRAFEDFGRTAKAALGERIRLFANLSAAQMAELYQTADVFAHAALREPFGIALVEAMASGLPVVGHSYEVTRWIIGAGGEVVDMNAAGALAAVLDHWRHHPDLRTDLGRRARERAAAQFAVERIVPLYLELYRHIRHGG